MKTSGSKRTRYGARSRRGGLLGLLAAWLLALSATSLVVATFVSKLASLERECASAFDDLDAVGLPGPDAEEESFDADLELPAFVPASAPDLPEPRVSGIVLLDTRAHGPERSTSPPERPPSLDA